jgi:N-acetyl-gamma-glutamylphosphate reductase
MTAERQSLRKLARAIHGEYFHTVHRHAREVRTHFGYLLAHGGDLIFDPRLVIVGSRRRLVRRRCVPCLRKLGYAG